MSTPSSLYAEKIFAEHPIAFWPLDDKADYVSLISEANRDLTVWDIENGTAEAVESILDEPFPESHTTEIRPVSLESFSSVVAVSPNTVAATDLNQDLSNFSISAMLYSKTPYISGFEIGYEYFDATSGNLVQRLKSFPSQISDSWVFISETFALPSDNSYIRLVIKANFFDGGTLEDLSFLVNGVSLGQWSEEFNATSLGVIPVEIPTNIFGAENIQAIPAKAYGLEELDGYYLVRNNALAAKNSGIPLVFGATNSTIVQQSGGTVPSLIIPGLGFLNKAGQYKDYTFEFWARINSDTSEEKRIFGNIRGLDGIYVKGSSISLKVGSHVIRHYVGQWYRPMLIQIRYSASSVGLVINGEQVGELSIAAETLEFPEPSTVFSSVLTLDNDWLGFWSYEDVSPIDLDGVAIYGYRVPEQMAKRRFVYGQGVEFPENINNAYSGSSVFIDYPFSKYSKNYNYPSLGKWRQGVYDNLLINGNSISFPSYSAPAVKFNNKTESEWLLDLEEAQNESDLFIKVRPDSSWNSSSGHLFFENANLLNEEVRGLYVVCKEGSLPSSEQTLLVIEDRASETTFEIKLDSHSIKYVINERGESSLIASKEREYLPGVGEKNAIAIDIRKFSDYYGGKAAQFFGRLSSPSVYVGSKKDFSEVFTGNIYGIGFCSAKNLNKISSVFGPDGLPISDDFVDGSLPHLNIADAGLYDNSVFQFLYDGGTLKEYSESVISGHTPSYGVTVGNSLSGFNLLISADSSWQDYVPLSFFAKNVLDSRGDEKLDLDFIQFNINYPPPSIFVQDEAEGNWTYEELQEEYSNPVQRNYDSLDNQLFTGYENYQDLKNRAVRSYKYDTSASAAKAYITFQLLEAGANKPADLFVNTELAPKNGIVSPGNNWLSTKYEVVDGMIIYPPQSVSFEDIAIVTHIELKSESIKDNPISIKSLEYASMSLSETSPTPIGTRFGNDIYPYRKDGFYFTYKERNPFSIYKGSTPYLYLTRNSGITVRGDFDPLVNRGISVPINEAKSEDYKVIAMQMAIRFDQDFFPYAPTKIFELQSKNSYIKFYMAAVDPQGKRAKVYAINDEGKLENGLSFFLNGKLVKNPILTIKEWAMIGIRFANTQEFGNYAGALRLTAPITYNNISYYKSTNLQEVQTVIERPWFKVKVAETTELEWDYWKFPFLWENVLIIATTSYYGVDPSDIYKIYTGTNKIVIDDEIEIQFGDYSYTVAEDIAWRSQVYQAV
jgi:hypothetical protein